MIRMVVEDRWDSFEFRTTGSLLSRSSGRRWRAERHTWHATVILIRCASAPSVPSWDLGPNRRWIHLVEAPASSNWDSGRFCQQTRLYRNEYFFVAKHLEIVSEEVEGGLFALCICYLLAMYLVDKNLTNCVIFSHVCVWYACNTFARTCLIQGACTRRLSRSKGIGRVIYIIL